MLGVNVMNEEESVNVVRGRVITQAEKRNCNRMHLSRREKDPRFGLEVALLGEILLHER